MKKYFSAHQYQNFCHNMITYGMNHSPLPPFLCVITHIKNQKSMMVKKCFLNVLFHFLQKSIMSAFNYLKNAEAAILQSEQRGEVSLRTGGGGLKNSRYCTFVPPPLLLLMIHHEETQLNALPQPYLTLSHVRLRGVGKCNNNSAIKLQD